jgi:hypothetical protein
MTNPCAAHGGSQARTGYGIAVDISAAGLAARFANTAGWFSAVIAGVIAGAQEQQFKFFALEKPLAPKMYTHDDLDAL